MTATQTDTEASSADTALEKAQKFPIVRIGKQVVAEFKEDDVPDVAAGVAYHAVFAIPPMIIFIVTLAALFEQVTSVEIVKQLLELIEERAPAETQELLTSLVTSAIADVSGGVASIGVAISALIALWSGSNGIATIIRAFNRAYGVKEDRSFVKQKALAIALTLLISILMVAAVTLFVFGEPIGNWVADQLGLSSVFETIWNIVRLLLAVVFFMFMLAVLYSIGPNIKQPFRWISPGAVVAMLAWGIVVYGFKIYVTYANPGSAYGAVGGVVVLLFFLYLSGIVFLLGAEINAVMQVGAKPASDLAESPALAIRSDDGTPIQQTQRNLATSPTTTVATRKPKNTKRGGIGERIGSMIGSRIVSFTSSKFGNDKQDAKPRQQDHE